MLLALQSRTGLWRSVAQSARAPVSKTGGWGFESLHSCHSGGGTANRTNRGIRVGFFWAKAERPRFWHRRTMASTSPFEFLQQVRSEAAKVTWPSRRETLITTAMVI